MTIFAFRLAAGAGVLLAVAVSLCGCHNGSAPSRTSGPYIGGGGGIGIVN